MKKDKLLTIIALLICSWSLQAQKKAVFIILDGIPADVVESVQTPTLDEIAKEGGYARAYTGGIAGGYSETPTISAVGYNSLLTSTWANKHNVWGNDIKAPNYHYWSIYRVAKSQSPALKTAIFSTWLDNRTKLVGEGRSEAGDIKLDYAFDGFEHDQKQFPHTDDRKFIFDIDEHVSKEAGRYIMENSPDLSWVYLEYTDDIGHKYGDSHIMYEAVKKADIQVKRVWDAIKYRKEHFKEDWMIVITTDHGRDAETGKGHGGQSERERTIWIVTNNDDLNDSFYQMPGMVDIMPSILSHMEIQIPEHTAREIDGTSFVGDIKAKALQADVTNGTLTLKWKPYAEKGTAHFFISTTNRFKEGGEDQYFELGESEIRNGISQFKLPDVESTFLKVLMRTDAQFLNTWITIDQR
ncbi:hemopexin repeat-containing protein [Fulvivirga imtechensis AK7]|uniref:Hemopexin repeat-containing protein n=1 Tax=Fulvivirga imtechensis AK7 TaxID=1237149 RepID=L8K119_9BACT|nr:alkaline phosphatase family protein [Fulvivirga imtechensis]ELR73152.1 hemopexin repeat-containing protein [Fulvivirga imtechensis AK7]